MSSLFHANMSYPKAQRTFFAAVRGKSRAEIDSIKKEYLAVLPSLMKKEITSNEGRLTSHPLK